MVVISTIITKELNRRSTCKMTVLAPSTAEMAELKEGKDIFVPYLNGIVFSGQITKVSAVKITPDSATTQKFKYDIEATSDMIKLKNKNVPIANVGVKNTLKAGGVIKLLLPDAPKYEGEIDTTSGGLFKHTISCIGCESALDDVISQNLFNWRTRRVFNIDVSTGYSNVGTTCKVEASAADFVNDGVDIGDHVLFTSGDGKYITGGAITEVTNLNTLVFTASSTDDAILPAIGDTFIVVQDFVFDYGYTLDGTIVNSFTVDRDIFRYQPNDDKTEMFTEVIVKGTDMYNNIITSRIAASHALIEATGMWSDCTFTDYRSEGVLYDTVASDSTTVIVVGHEFKGLDGGKIFLVNAAGLANEYTISGVPIEDTLPDGTRVTKITTTVGASVEYPKGTPVLHRYIYVVDNTVLPIVDAPVWIGEERMSITAKGSEINGGATRNYIEVQPSNRSTSIYSPTYNHPMGVLVRDGSYSFIEYADVGIFPTQGEVGSPVERYGRITKTITPSAARAYNRGDLDRFATASILKGSDIHGGSAIDFKGMTGAKGQIPLQKFYKGSGIYPVPIEIGDTVTINTKDTAARSDNYQITSYRMDLFRKIVDVQLGIKDANVVERIKTGSDPVTRTLV